MINRETLAQIATRSQTAELNVAREYCQHLFLQAFYQQKGSERVMFKGGTALKIVYGSPRFSEDLDFSGFGVSVYEIEDWVLATMQAIERSGIEVDLQESKTTSGGYLANLDCRLHAHHVRIQIEISLRQANDIEGQGTLIAPDLLPAYALTLLPEARLVEEKLTALLTRSKPRDFFDLYFLLRKGLIPSTLKPRLAAAREALQNATVDFHRDLAPFLPRSHLAIVKDLPRTLDEELKRHGV